MTRSFSIHSRNQDSGSQKGFNGDIAKLFVSGKLDIF